MGQVLPEIGDKEAAFITSQKVFFVATAPLSIDHHISLSPKANKHGSLIVLDPHTVAYADLTGSGAETAAHVQQNGRMTIMVCNLEKGWPKIVRLWGTAHVILAENATKSLLDRFAPYYTENPGFRAIYKLDVKRIMTSCGFSMPIMTFDRYRNILDEVIAREGKDGTFNYMTLKNSYSIDGLPSLALWRRNAPVGLVPVQEDGYFLGKTAEQSTSLLVAVRQWIKHLKWQFQMTLSRRLPFGVTLVAAALTFLIGLGAGQSKCFIIASSATLYEDIDGVPVMEHSELW